MAPHAPTRRRVRQTPPDQQWLIFTTLEGDPAEVVVRTATDAIHGHQIFVAVETAKTWGEFRALLPQGEWTHVEDALFQAWRYRVPSGESHSSVERDDTQISDWWTRYQDDGPFSAWMIPGFPLFYPRWAQQHLTDIIPPSVLKRYATLTPSANPNQGPFWRILETRGEALATALRRRGHHVEWVDFLQGF
ncbi:MAG: hypothetical protein O3A25_14335 [Acidobacteria bacterium]|nr:hypothetical protein [Acidobacteriota bacterium]